MNEKTKREAFVKSITVQPDETEEFVLAPGESKTFAKTLAPDTRFLGVLAAYRDVEHAKWRSIVPVQPGQMHTVVIHANELAVEAALSGGGR